MSRKRRKPKGDVDVLASPSAKRATEPRKDEPLSRGRSIAFAAISLALPFLLVGAAEVGLRYFRPSDGLPLFVTAPIGNGKYLTANPAVARRWFAGVARPPAPPPELFASDKPANGFRLFVLGESTTAGFPYPRNGTFSRVLRDALKDVLPGDSVEVVNLGIAATNSYAVADIAAEVAQQEPDAVLIYAGHNEYYGALGAASSQGSGSPTLTRLSLAMQRSRLYLALRDILAGEGSAAADSAPSFMEILARDRPVPLGSEKYRVGIEQFGGNLERALAEFSERGIPVFVGSLVSNLRDQVPFAAEPNEAKGGARQIFTAARAALSAGDSAGAQTLFSAARDADVVRFRAPSAFDSVVRAVSERAGAHYVSVRELFDSLSPARTPGFNFFLEHVHPNRAGAVLLAQAYYSALASQRFLGHSAAPAALESWSHYDSAMTLTRFDELVADHSVRTLTARWPFVTEREARDYRGTYVPAGFADSLAFAVSRGALPWSSAKLALAQHLESRKLWDAAIAEYEGMARDLPLSELPLRLMALAHASGGRPEVADSLLFLAATIEPTGEVFYARAQILLDQKKLPEAIPLLQEATRRSPRLVGAWYQLSLAYGLMRDLSLARATAERAAAIDPSYPGLQGWMATIGLRP